MQLAILGASGHGKVIADTATAVGWQRIVFFDDAWPQVKRNGIWEVVGDTKELLRRMDEFDGVIVGIGNCEVRRMKHELLRAAGACLVTIIHPRAWISPGSRIGPGSVVMAGAVINVDTSIGEAGIVNTGATVDHDCVLADAVHISPGAHLSGNVLVGSQSWIGVGAVVRQGIKIGSSVMVGAGAVVVKPVTDSTTVVGNPASPLKHA